MTRKPPSRDGSGANILRGSVPLLELLADWCRLSGVALDDALKESGSVDNGGENVGEHARGDASGDEKGGTEEVDVAMPPKRFC